MIKKFPRYLIKYGILPAIFYTIPLAIFVKDEKFSETWLLYLGNALFLCYIFIFGIFYAKQQNIKISPINAALAVTLMGVIFSCVLAIATVFIFAPGWFNIGSSNQVLKNTPAALPDKHSHGAIFILFANVIIGNFAAGSFSSVLSAGATKQIKTPGG